MFAICTKCTHFRNEDPNSVRRDVWSPCCTDRPEAIAAWRAEPRTSRGGQPCYSDLAIATALTLQAVFRLALRQTEGLIGSILQLLGLDLPVPDHSTLSRRAETLAVPRPQAGGAPVHLLVDGVAGKRLTYKALIN